MIGEAPKWMQSENIIIVEDSKHRRPRSLRLGLKPEASDSEKEVFEKEMNLQIKSLAKMIFPEMENPYYTWDGKVIDKGRSDSDDTVDYEIDSIIAQLITDLESDHGEEAADLLQMIIDYQEAEDNDEDVEDTPALTTVIAIEEVEEPVDDIPRIYDDLIPLSGRDDMLGDYARKLLGAMGKAIRHDDNPDDDVEWITVNGAHIPMKDGDLKGEVGNKIEKESKTTASKQKGRTKKGSPEWESQRKSVVEREAGSSTKEIHPYSRNELVLDLASGMMWAGLGRTAKDLDRHIKEFSEKIPEDDGWLELHQDKRFNYEQMTNCGSDYAKLVYMKSMESRADTKMKAIKEAIETGDYDSAIKRIAYDAASVKIKPREQEYEMLNASVDKWVGEIDVTKADKDIKGKFGLLSDTPTADYYEAVKKSHENMSYEEYQTEQVYTYGGYGTKAQLINEKLYTGKELTDAEEAVVQQIENSAVTIEKPMTFFRMVGENFLPHQFGRENVADINKLVGRETTIASLSSSTCGAVLANWAGLPVMLKIDAPAGTKVTFPYNDEEGEAIFGRGLKLRVKSVEYSNADFPVWEQDYETGLHRPTAYSKSSEYEYTGEIMPEHLRVHVEVVLDG